MADLPNRIDREQELIALLLLIFASRELSWWLSPVSVSREWMRREIVRRDIPDFARKITDTSRYEMLDEIDEIELLDDRNLMRMVEGIEDRFADNLANDLFAAWENWRGEASLQNFRGADPKDLYPEWKARRDASTHITKIISWTEDRTRAGLDQFFGITLLGQWKLDPFSNWCEFCLAVADTYEPFWRPLYPDGPPIHPWCVLPDTEIAGHSRFESATKSFYRGRVVEIRLSSGRRFTVTENHLVPTSAGLLPAKFLQAGEDCFSSRPNVQFSGSGTMPDDDQTVARAEDLFASLKVAHGMTTTRMPASAEQLHGDGEFVEGDIEVVLSDLLLEGVGHSDRIGEQSFFGGGLANHRPGSSGTFGLVTASTRPSRAFMGSPNLPFPLLGGHRFPQRLVRLRSPSVDGPRFLDPVGDGTPAVPRFIADRFDRSSHHVLMDEVGPVFGFPTTGSLRLVWPQGDSATFQGFVDRRRVDLDAFSRFRNRNPEEIQLDRIIDARHREYSGYVYDFGAGELPYYLANGVWVHNCRCYVHWMKWAGEGIPFDYRAPSRRQGEIIPATAIPQPLQRQTRSTPAFSSILRRLR